MSENIVADLKRTIDNLKTEILQKQDELDLLILKYQELVGDNSDEIE